MSNELDFLDQCSDINPYGTCTVGNNLFSAKAGQVVAVYGNAVPIHFAVDGNETIFNDLNAIVTSIGIQAQGGYQFMHALREFIYVYVFTERVGEIVINGLAFPQACNFGPQGAQDSGCVFGKTGFERICSWYDCNRITSRAAAIVISLGTEVTYDAFLVALKADIVNADTGIAQFTMRFNFIPNASTTDDFCFPTTPDCLFSPCAPEMLSLVDDLED